MSVWGEVMERTPELLALQVVIGTDAILDDSPVGDHDDVIRHVSNPGKSPARPRRPSDHDFGGQADWVWLGSA